MIEEIFSDKWMLAKTPIERRDVIKNRFGFVPTIVYLDDEIELLSLFEKQIFSLGLDVFTTSDLDEMILYIKKFNDKIACIISDFKMPKMTGLDFRKKILDSSREITFFLLSGYIDADTVLKSVGLKVHGFFDKPFSEDQLVQFFQRKNISQDVLNESDLFLEQYEDFNSFWKNAFSQSSMDVYLISTEIPQPIKADIIDFYEDLLSLSFQNRFSENTKEFFIKIIIHSNQTEKKLLYPAEYLEKNSYQGEGGLVSHHVEFKLNGLKKEDEDLIQKVTEERQSLATQYLQSLQKQKKKK